MAFDDELKSAQTAWKKRDAAGTVKALEAALASARQAAPLEIRAVAVIHHDHTGLGVYTPAPGDVVEGRRARLYVEVANHTSSPLGNGVFRVQLDVSGDFAYEDPHNGGALMKLQTVSLGSQSYETRTVAGVTSFGVELRLGDKSPAGSYRVTLKVKDAISNNANKTATREARLVLT